MFTIILGFFRQHLLFAGELGLIAALVFQHAEIGRLDGRLAACRRDNAMLSEANHSLSDLASVQTAAITRMQEESEEKKKAAALALAHAQQDAKAHVVRAQKIKAYSTSDNECHDMRALLDTYFRR